jgi:hypothetical protein
VERSSGKKQWKEAVERSDGKSEGKKRRKEATERSDGKK